MQASQRPTNRARRSPSRPSWHPARLRGARAGAGALLLGLLASVGGCDGCGEPSEPAAAPEAAAEGSATEAAGGGFAVYGAPSEAPAEPAEDAPPAPPPEIQHAGPPTADDLRIAPVEGDWTGYRGGDARSGVRDVRSIRNPVIRWSKQVGIQGYKNTPIVTADAVYVSGQGDRHENRRDEVDERDGVYRLDPATGAEVWVFRTGANVGGMTWAEGSLVFGDDQGKVYRLDPETGRPLWTVETGCRVHFAPVVDGERVMFARERSALVLSLATGEILSQPEERCHNNHRGAFARDGGDVWLGAHDAPLQLYREGELVWQAPAPGASQRTRYRAYTPPLLTESMAIALYNELRFADPERGDRFALAAVAHWRDNGQVAWIIEIDRAQDAVDDVTTGSSVFNHAMPLLVGDRLYLLPTNRGRIEAWDATTGRRVAHADFPDCRRRQFGSPVATTEVAYVPRHDGGIHGVSLDPLRVLWSLPMGLHGAIGARETHEPIAGGCSPRPIDGTALFATPAIGADGTLYVGSGDGWLYAVADRDW